MAIFYLVVNWNDFSVPFECHSLLKYHDIILHVSFYWHHKCHYQKLEHVIVMITSRWNADTGGKDHFWIKSYYVTSVANNGANPFIFFYLWLLHDMSPCYSNIFERKNMALTLIRILKIQFHRYRYEIMPWYYVMILWVFYSFYFGQCGVLLKDHMMWNQSKFQQPTIFGSWDIVLWIWWSPQISRWCWRS